MDYIFTFEDGSEALAHYGVLGMKWGVRRDRSKAYDKSMGKLQKLDTKAAKYQGKADARVKRITSRFNRSERAGKMQAKAAKLETRAAKLDKKAAKRLVRGDQSGFVKANYKAMQNRERASKLTKKATGVDARTEKLRYKQEKYQYKASKWAKRMNKEFGSTKMSSTKEQRALGKKYVLSMVG